MSDVTRILDEIEQGDPSASEQLLPLVYEELRKLAASRLANENPGQTLQATALVHEAYLRLLGDGCEQDWEGRGHFFAAAAEAMRRILIERARRKHALKRGGDRQREGLSVADVGVDAPDIELIALDHALQKLDQHDPVKAELVKLRYFAGLTLPQAAVVLGIGRSTADKYWAYAKCWLRLEIDGRG